VRRGRVIDSDMFDYSLNCSHIPPKNFQKLVHKNAINHKNSHPHSSGFYNANTVKSSKEFDQKPHAPTPPGVSTTVHLWLASDKFNNILDANFLC
jgi:hypothetical protein